MIGGGVPEKLGDQGEDIKLEPRGVQGVEAANGVLGDEERPSEKLGCVSSGHGTGDYVSFKEVSRAKLRWGRVIDSFGVSRRCPWTGVNFTVGNAFTSTSRRFWRNITAPSVRKRCGSGSGLRS